MGGGSSSVEKNTKKSKELNYSLQDQKFKVTNTTEKQSERPKITRVEILITLSSLKPVPKY